MDLNNTTLKKDKIEIIQVNLGDLCNKVCEHCHVEASPKGTRIMSKETAEKVLTKILAMDVKEIEFTGGAPEMNENLKMFIEELSKNHRKITVRTNLTILDDEKYSFFLELYKKHNVNLVASLPCYGEENVDKQRGKGTFDKSIKILKKLNKLGYGEGKLNLSLVYNPLGAFLPPEQKGLEKDYKKKLKDNYNIHFDNLLTIVNNPIKRFKEKLQKEGSYENYLKLLKDNFNKNNIDKLMCKKLISVDYEGYVYDCDFNFVLGLKLFEDKKFWEIDFDNLDKNIILKEHCYACTAGSGSSCYGALSEEFDVKKVVKKYYGKVLKSSKDLKTSACCAVEDIPKHIKKVTAKLPDEIITKFYGCGSPIPYAVEGLKVLDLGSGTGKDCYVLSKLVGEDGFIYGIDMTENQIEIALKYIKEYTSKLNYKKPNMRFIHDYIENAPKHIEENSIDLVISNCVINLLEDKSVVINAVYKMLKDGGEMYFSDIYLDRRIEDEVRKDPILYGECLGGALYYRDFESLAKKAGFADARIVSKREVAIHDKKIKNLLGNTKAYSITYRLWKIDGLEESCEDYGQVAIYNGGLEEEPLNFVLDKDHIFEKNRPEKVCRNTALMLSKTRFKKFFQIIGEGKEHFGEFKDCSTSKKDNNEVDIVEESCCC